TNNASLSFETEWKPAVGVVRNLLNRKNVSKAEWHDLFTTNNRITSWVDDGPARLLRELEKEIQYHVSAAAKRIHGHNDEMSLLQSYIAEWENYAVLAKHLPLPFNFLERTQQKNLYGTARSTKKEDSLQIVRNAMLDSWYRIVFKKISERLLSAAMKLIERERNGESVDTRIIVGVRESFVDLDVENVTVRTDQNGKLDSLQMYEIFFERSYLTGTEHFYKSRTAQVLEANGILSYMAYADEKLAEEEARARRYLDLTLPDSVERLVDKCVNVLVIEYQEQLLNEGPALIKNRETKRLKMLYRLINKTPDGIQTLLEALGSHIRTEGLHAMHANAEHILTDSEKYVDQLLTMYRSFSNLVQDAFCNDPRFLTVRDQAFQDVVNNTDVFRLELTGAKGKNQRQVNVESKCPELLANYCDLLLRKSQLTKRLTSDEIDEKLNDVLLVLKYVNNKDVFMRYHKTHVSRRLILELVADQEKEENLVNKFREAGMPADYVNKLFRMLQDIEVNKDLNLSFKKSIGANNNYRTMADYINIKILNAGAWSRSREKAKVSLPRELEEIVPEVEDFYKKQHSGRKLTWVHSWSTGTITFANKMGKYDLEVTTFQMAVLFCWNDRPLERVSYETMKLATELTDADLNRTLLSLVAYPKTKQQILLTDCDPINPKNFTDSTLFWVNQDFSVVKNDKPQPRGKLNLIGRLQMNPEPSANEEHEDIIRLREFRVQEAITELVEMLKHMFLPSRKLIKEQTEWLIEQHFLARHTDDINTFVYVT
ncbi:Cullin, partial [Aphelenchoides avenae]